MPQQYVPKKRKLEFRKCSFCRNAKVKVEYLWFPKVANPMGELVADTCNSASQAHHRLLTQDVNDVLERAFHVQN